MGRKPWLFKYAMTCVCIALAIYLIAIVANQLIIQESLKGHCIPKTLYLKQNMQAVRESALDFRSAHGRLPNKSGEVSIFLRTPASPATPILINPYTSHRELPGFARLGSWQTIRSELKLGQVLYVETGPSSFSVAGLGDSGFLVWADKDQFSSTLAQ